MKCCMNGGNVIRLLFLSVKLLKFEIQKCGQILCAHKPYFLMPGHILYPTLYNIMHEVVRQDTWEEEQVMIQDYSKPQFVQTSDVDCQNYVMLLAMKTIVTWPK